MKKPLLFIIVLFLFLASCKKNASVGPVNTLSATINGVDESFNTNLYAQNGTGVTTNSDLAVFGTTGTASNAEVLSITVNTNATIATGTYTNSASSNSGFISILYSKGPVNLFTPNEYVSDVNGTYLTTVKVTSISNTNVQGTFSAQLLYTDGKTKMMVTNGKFNVNFK